ncbi:MAG: hypothetical protein TEF_14795 [Rhizobiales bacterium NRL2]|jgi:N,N-dimethylformamidase|nr:MAG: hypothetical protein TEF_14795 [Rhizobiales bacterium NRL2]
MREKTITGYCNPFSATPGETIGFMVSTYAPGDYEAELVHVRAGDDFSDASVGVIEDVLAADFAGTYPGRNQPLRPGSSGVVESGAPIGPMDGLTVAAWIWPTLPGGRPQSILGCWDADRRAGFRLLLDADGALALEIADGKGGGRMISTGTPVLQRQWYRVSASYDAGTGEVRLSQQPDGLSPGQSVAAGAAEAQATLEQGLRPDAGEAPVMFAASAGAEGPVDHYNGKIDRPRIAARALDQTDVDRLMAAGPDESLRGDLIGCWDFSCDIRTDRITDLGPGGRHGRLINLPARASTGFNWTGEAHDWREKPGHYGAVHFHDDDLYDAGWEQDFSFTVPADLPSGLYAVRLRHGGDVDRIPFVVRPPVGTATAPAVFLMPTASYLAYANYRLRLKANPIFGDGRPKCVNDAFLGAHPELSGSTYDLHSDRSGVQYSSRLRPVTNMKPGDNRPWGLPADCNILALLDHVGEPFDIVTDEDLHQHGAALLAPYRCVITGSHPEYHSTAMLDALETFTGQGGRLMYMGGNGFYWRVAFRDDLPGVLEVRRAEDGTRAWIAEPGEYYHAFNGEYGGLWRRQGRPPNRLAGVGFAAQGFERSTYYRRRPEADDPRAAFIMAGVTDEVIGDFGTVGGGAAGEEIDRHDVRLGSPRHALVVATSEDHGEQMLRTKEEFLSTIPWFDDPKVRADLTFFECPNGGAVFSTGSISWAGSLGHENWNNNVARITTNVLRRFIDPTPFELPGETAKGDRR